MDRYYSTRFAVVIAVFLTGCQSSTETENSTPIDTSSNLLAYTAPKNISNTSTYSHDESLTISADGTIHVFWLDSGDILYGSSTDNGVTFDSPELIVPTTLPYSYGYPRAAHTTNAIHLSWTVYDNSRGAEIFYMRSLDGGNSFSDPHLVSVDDGLNSYASSITTDQHTRVGISWSNLENVGANRTRFVTSEDEGMNFSTPSSLPAQQGLSPELLLTTEALYATWAEGDAWTPEIYFASSTDGGSSFSAPMNISQYPEKSWHGAMAVDAAGTIYIVWVEGAAFQDRKILFAESVDGGQSFSTPVTLSDPSTDSFCPSIAASSAGRFYIAWSSSDDAYVTNKSYVIASDNGGMTFTPMLRLPMITSDAGCPKFALNGTDQLGMVWNSISGGGQYPEIFFSNVTVSIP